VLKTGQVVTVSCAEGETGFVYEGRSKFEVQKVDLATLSRPKTKIMMNLGNPEEAFRLSQIPNDGVGLARLEFIVSTFIKIHPLALLHFDRVNAGDQAEIARLTSGYPDRPQYFVDKLAEGVAMIAAGFYPRDVIVRLSDFKTNEYANLIGGKAFEPIEENPMLGFRGASRYYHDRYRDGFALECRAMKKVRDEMGRDGPTWPGSRAKRVGSVCHVRDSEQRDPRGSVRQHFRRVLHWLERSNAAYARRRSRLRDCRADL
jgi:pyruvate,water dikinase